jgi:hypothetical protein
MINSIFHTTSSEYLVMCMEVLNKIEKQAKSNFTNEWIANIKKARKEIKKAFDK